MMKHMKLLKILFILLGLAPSMQATVSFFISAEVLRDAQGEPMAITGSVALVSAGADGEFAGPDADCFVTGDDVLLGRVDLSAVQIPGIVDDMIGPVALSSQLTEGQALALYWFPEVGIDATSPGAGVDYGIYTPDNASGAGWVVPAESSAVSLNLFTVDASILNDGGEVPNDETLAFFKTPEPDSVAPVSGPGPLFVIDDEQSDSWYRSSWFGAYNGSSAPWFFHVNLGWMYTSESRSEAALWFYTEDTKWAWMNEDSWPYFWHDETQSWYYCWKNNAELYFYDIKSKVWLAAL